MVQVAAMRPRTPVKGDGRHAANAAAVEEEREREKGERDRHLGLRAKKGMGVRTWLLIDGHGSAQELMISAEVIETLSLSPTMRAGGVSSSLTSPFSLITSVQVVEAAKHAIMRRACLPARDLRILDPLLSYPSTILGREHAIVVNLEHIKAIITAQEVLLLNSQDAAVVPFVEDLKRRLPLHLNALGQAVAGDGGGGLSDNEGDLRMNTNSPMDALRRIPSGHELNGEAAMQTVRMELQGGLNAAGRSPSLPQLRTGFKEDGSSPGRTRGGPSILPFEFRALEACLEAACSSLDAEALTLEREAYPALDELTSKISTLNLEHVRQIKSRLVAISGRVQKVRDEIEQLLDDDGDMAEMYLTDKLLQQHEGFVSPTASVQAFGPVSLNITNAPMLDSSQAPPVNSNNASLQFDGPGSDGEEDRNMGTNGTMHDGHGGAEMLSDRGRGSSSSTATSTVTTKALDVEELEMLLEAYFVQIDGTLNKLSTLREYVDDTEDYINIMLDDKQNHLLQMGVMLTTATLVISAFIVVTGVFGMNINIPLFNDGGLDQFLWVVLGTASICVILYFAVIGWCKYKHLIE